MNNSQLLYELNKLNLIVNELDRFEAIQKFNTEYKQSNFYKNTKLPITEVLKYLSQAKLDRILTTVADLLNGDTLVAKINEMLDNIDADAMTKFFDNLASAFDPAELKELQGELTASLNKFPR